MPKKPPAVDVAAAALDELADTMARAGLAPAHPLDADGNCDICDNLGTAAPPAWHEPAPPSGPAALKPGEPGYDWAGAYGTADLFRYTFPNGTVVALKAFASIYSKTWLWKIRKAATDSDVQFAAIERGTCDAAKAVLDDLPDDGADDPIDDLFTAWAASGTDGLTLGE